MRRGARLSVLLLWAFACTDPARERGAQASSQARGPVVARVQGTAIGLEQVRELAEATGISPREALAMLEDALLLEQHARQRGYDRSELVVAETQRALVRALLAETVEAEVTPESIDQDDLRERFANERPRLGLPADSFPKYEEQLRQQVTLERRSLAVERLANQLRSKYGVSLDEAKVHKLLADPSLWGGGR